MPEMFCSMAIAYKTTDHSTAGSAGDPRPYEQPWCAVATHLLQGSLADALDVLSAVTYTHLSTV